MAAPFRLARIQHVREQMLRLRIHEAGQLTAQLAAVRTALQRIVAERERRGLAEAEQAVAGTLTPEALHVGRAYDAALATAERVHGEEIARLVRALEAKRLEVLRDRQEEEKYSRLAAAHQQRALEAEARETERNLDEIAVNQYRRNRKERRHAGV